MPKGSIIVCLGIVESICMYRSAGLALVTLPALLAAPAFARDTEKARAT